MIHALWPKEAAYPPLPLYVCGDGVSSDAPLQEGAKLVARVEDALSTMRWKSCAPRPSARRRAAAGQGRQVRLEGLEERVYAQVGMSRRTSIKPRGAPADRSGRRHGAR